MRIIPPELTFAIAEHLPVSSVIAWSLTCKHFLYLYGIREGAQSQRATFLALLQRDLPNHYQRYHRDYSLKQRHPTSTPLNYTPFDYPHEKTYAILTRHFNYTISLSHMLLAVKRATCGPDHGIPLSAFAHQAESSFAGDDCAVLRADGRSAVKPITMTLETQAKIVAGKLLLRCTYHITRRPDAGTLRIKDLGLFRWDLCRHTSTQVRMSPWYVINVSSFFFIHSNFPSLVSLYMPI